MPKVTLDKETFKALASDTRLDILRTLDGKRLGLNEISKVTNLNKATLHEHLTKLHEAGLVKRHEREGHKWVYYRLSWKGESLLHPENTRIVVLFTMTFIALWGGILQLITFVKGSVIEGGHEALMSLGQKTTGGNETIPYALDENPSIPERFLIEHGDGEFNVLFQDPIFLYIAIACFLIFTIVLVISLWCLCENRTPKI